MKWSVLSGRLAAELIGTFALIYFGCGAVVTRTLVAGQYSMLTRASGVILLAIGLFGIWAEVLPSL